MDTNFLNNGQYIFLSLLIVFFIVGVVAYKKGKTGVFFVSLIALVMWLLSAVMNVWTGYSVGGVMSLYGSLFGALFMLVTEFIVPASLVYKRKTESPLPIIVSVAVIMAVALSVFSFWNGAAMSMNTHFAEMMKAQDDTRVKQVSLEKIDIESSKYSITAQQSVQPLNAKIQSLGGADAKNLAGSFVFARGTRQTVLDVTNNCTSGYYYNSSKLYKGTCGEINRLRKRVSSILSSNKAVTVNKDKMLEITGKKEELLVGIAQNNYKDNTAMPFIAMIVSAIGGKQCDKGDTTCEKSNNDKIKATTSAFAFYIALFAEIAKTALVVLAVGLLIPNSVKPVSITEQVYNMIMFVITSPIKIINWRKDLVEVVATKKAQAHGSRMAELDFEQSKRDEDRKNQILLLEADTWMKSITLEQVSLVVDVDKMMRGKKVKKEDVLMLLILVCREFSENNHIPLHSTLNNIISKAENDTKYIDVLLGSTGMDKGNMVTIVKDVCKLHRLRGIILPALLNAKVVELKSGSDGDQHYWKSNLDIEDLFKYAIKKQLKIKKEI